MNYEGHGMIINNCTITYKSEYCIGTGGTWKGGIGDFYFLIPSKYKFNKIRGCKYIGNYRSYDIYRIENYNPPLAENIAVTTIVSREYYEESESLPCEQGEPGFLFSQAEAVVNNMLYPETKRQDGATYLGVSSAETIDLVQYTPEGTYNITTGAEDVFDGSVLTGWATESGGRGEWLEFRLDKDAVGFSIKQGFYELSGDFGFAEMTMNYFRTRYPEDEKGYYCPSPDQLFNTMESISIIPRGKKESRPIFLERRLEGEGSFIRLYMPAGIYRLQIKEIQHAGSEKYNSAFISELEFSFCPLDIFTNISNIAGEDLEFHFYPSLDEGF